MTLRFDATALSVADLIGSKAHFRQGKQYREGRTPQCEEHCMAWAIPEHSKRSIDMAGAALVSRQPLDEQTAAVIGNWRAAHSYPMFHLRINLSRIATEHGQSGFVSQRLKRLSSIRLKLQLNEHMKLSQMQDIGGCRLIANGDGEVRKIIARMHKSRAAHELSREDNYIDSPKDSGYRSHHLVYRYRNPNKAAYDGLRIEIQVRSRSQHAWATAVEIAGTFQGQALKSSLGSEEWLYFFKLMGSDMALRERCALVPGTPTKIGQLRGEIRKYQRHLQVVAHLRGWQKSLQQAKNIAPGSQLYLLQLFPAEDRVVVQGFKKQDLDRANAAYLALEEEAISHGNLSDTVLVSVDSLVDLQRAYPNYFSDTQRFVRAVHRAIS